METSSNKATGIIVGLVALLLIGGGLWWVLNMDNDNTEDAASSSQTQEESSDSAEEQGGTIVVVAQRTPTLSTLVRAVQAAELVDTLQSAGPFTVFAPTDEAFESLPEGTLSSLLLPENKGQLQSVLTYHVVSGSFAAQDLRDGQVLTTVQGGTLTVKVMDGKVYIVDAKGTEVPVEAADVNADNGIVHVIGGVLLPQ